MQIALKILFKLMELSGWLNKYAAMLTDKEREEVIAELEETSEILKDD